MGWWWWNWQKFLLLLTSLNLSCENLFYGLFLITEVGRWFRELLKIISNLTPPKKVVGGWKCWNFMLTYYRSVPLEKKSIFFGTIQYLAFQIPKTCATKNLVFKQHKLEKQIWNLHPIRFYPNIRCDYTHFWFVDVSSRRVKLPVKV